MPFRMDFKKSDNCEARRNTNDPTIQTKNFMKKIGVVLSGFFLLFALNSCYYDKADQVYPQTLCDTTNITLSGEINNILSANCFRCHSNTNSAILGGNYNLQDFNTIHSAAIDGRLLSSITQDNKLAPPMPEDGGKLSDCDINKFRDWINQGAPDN
jgi:hypothetical protein